MYEDIGGKIKGLAKTVCIIGIVISCIYGVIMLFVGGLAGFFAGILIAGIGSLSSWLGTLMMYGFGEMIDAQITAANNTTLILGTLRAGNSGSAQVVSNSAPVISGSTSGFYTQTPTFKPQPKPGVYDPNKVPAWKRVEMQAKAEEVAKKAAETATETGAFCPRCGQQLPSDAVFCPHCGNHC